MSAEVHDVLQIYGVVVNAWTKRIVACQLQTDQRVLRIRPIHHDRIAVWIPTTLNLRTREGSSGQAIAIGAVKDTVIAVTGAPLWNELIDALGVEALLVLSKVCPLQTLIVARAVEVAGHAAALLVPEHFTLDFQIL
ncbi:MAG: hypothetical protein EoVTN8_5 [Fluviibacter phosphoraccumulans EoVTN8]